MYEFTYKDIYYNDVADMMMEADKSQGLWGEFPSRRPRRVYDADPL